MTTWFDTAELITHFLGGCLLVLCVYVVLKYIAIWRETPRERPLPLHVWIIMISYMLLVLSAIIRDTYPVLAFSARLSGFLIGMYALWILARPRASK